MAPRIQLARIYPVVREIMGPAGWRRARSARLPEDLPEHFPETLQTLLSLENLPPYLPDLARLEWAWHQAGTAARPTRPEAGPAVINPTVELVQCQWQNLALVLASRENCEAIIPGEEIVAAWQDTSGRRRLEPAAPGDLTALKLTLEESSPEMAAREAGVPLTIVAGAMREAIRRGLLLAPPSQLCRDPARFARGRQVPDEFETVRAFNLQWHLTQACDLNCRHCYDRSSREIPSLAQGLEVLRQLQEFCRERQVAGQVAFTGGNPFLHPNFYDFFQAATDLGFGCAVLGNPVPEEKLEKLAAIGTPCYYQVSLEGLEEHNDEIRGTGNFRRVLSFLESLRRFGIPGMVMLTLTRANLRQVLPLAEVLRPLADGFNFNRLALFGEGKNLRLPGAEEYQAFLGEYLAAAAHNPVLSLKDNLFNILLEEKGFEPFGGCTGFGCGAAFNFMALLSDGEVHACRKLPSLVGNLKEASLAEIYDGAAARRYRRGCAACRDCRLHPVCGGCLAVTASLGLDPFTERDPFCFREEQGG